MRFFRTWMAVFLLALIALFVVGCASVDEYDPKNWDPEEGRGDPPILGIPI